MRQGNGGGLRGPPTVQPGNSIDVDVQADGVTEVIVNVGGSSNEAPTTVKVGPDGKVSVPADPAWTPGTVIYISTASPPYNTIIVEVVTPGD